MLTSPILISYLFLYWAGFINEQALNGAKCSWSKWSGELEKVAA